jgi:DNA replication protein DnaC
MSDLLERAKALRLHGLLNNWGELSREPWLEKLLGLEETERGNRSLKARLEALHVGAYKPMANFDWAWPRKINRDLVAELFTFRFIQEKANVVFLGGNGVGKTMLLKNLAHQAVLAGHTVRFITASDLLNDLSAQEGAIGLNRRMKHYSRPTLLAIDELGYLSYDCRHADLLFELVSRRYGRNSIALTTNLPFKHWNQVFPNSASVGTLIDRLLHVAEIVDIDADSYRGKEALERAERRKKKSRESRRT